MARAAATSASNNSLHAAKAAKNDEFYTQISDIENELRHYKEHLIRSTYEQGCLHRWPHKRLHLPA